MITSHNQNANALIEAHPGVEVIVKVEKMQRGHIDKWHKHPWHQLLFPFEGILQTKVASSQYVVPHTGVLFIPADTFHESFVMTETQFIGIYLDPQINIEYPELIKVITSTPLIRELIFHIIDVYASSSRSLQKAKDNKTTKILDVLFDQINECKTYDITLLLPQDRRLMVIFNALIQTPQLDTKLAEWAKQVGASERTLSRLFMKELGMSFPLWRQHIRLVSSLSLLEEKLSIQEVAFSVGYNSDSSYIFAFKSLFNQTPQQYRMDGYNLTSRITSN